MKLGFDTKKYLDIQKKAISQRISKFGSKLYLEFGGKLVDDYHASRVLPGFEPDAKLQLLLSFKEKAEVIIVVNAKDVNDNKVRGDSNISYQAEVIRLINFYNSVDLPIAGVAITLYEESKAIREFSRLITHLGVKVYKHYKINGYPKDLPLILSKDGLGKNEFIETKKPLVIVTAPGPGSGKMATCLSQLYNSSIKGIKAGYAKYETFPVWNLPLKHPVNLAYEAATLDLEDVNMIDPFHLEHYNETAVNYNRDIESFPLLKAIFEKLYGKCPYFSPTDMGVNKVGFAITNDKICQDASKQEIIRRYYAALKSVFLGKSDDEVVVKSEWLMNQVGVKPDDRKCVSLCLEKVKKTNVPVVSIQIDEKNIVTGKETKDLTASSAALINALKSLGKIDDKIHLIQPIVCQTIQRMKKESFGIIEKLSIPETLACLSIQSITSPLASIALKQLSFLKSAQAHSSCLLKDAEISIFKKLGIDTTETVTPVLKIKNE